MRILVLNAGSSSLKASVVEPPARAPVAAAAVDWGADTTRHGDRLRDVQRLLGQLEEAGGWHETVDGVGHRVVHGGPRYTDAVLVDDEVVAALDDLRPLAPLHNALATETISAARRALGGVAHVAAFDTAFHATLPESARRYPLPERWSREWGVRRYGFHGLSVAWATRRAAELLERPVHDLALVVAHLGSGCSVTAVDAGRSRATSMGMTPLEGLMMGTRAGSIDPGIVLRLLRDQLCDLDTLADALDHGSGLLAVSGTSADMRRLVAAADDGDGRAAVAIEMFVERAAAGIAAAATALPRLDALVFTGGIGENAATVRAAIVDRLGSLGVPSAPATDAATDSILAAVEGGPAVLRVEAREDLVIADAVVALLSQR